MTREDSPRQSDARGDGKGSVVTRHDAQAPTHDSSDSPTDRPVPGLLIPKPPPDGVEGEATSDLRGKADDGQKADADLEAMERNAEDGRE